MIWKKQDDLNAYMASAQALPLPRQYRSTYSAFLKLLRRPSCSLYFLFDHYRQLPFPRIGFLPGIYAAFFISKFLTHPSQSESLTIRYLTVLDDMRHSGIPVTIQERNAALHFIGRSFRRVTYAELEACLDRWKIYKETLDFVSDTATYNILLQVSMRANADDIVKRLSSDMDHNGIDYDHFTWTAFIRYYGLRRDRGGVRRSWEALQDSPHKSSMNARLLIPVFNSLLRVGEKEEARHLFKEVALLAHSPSYLSDISVLKTLFFDDGISYASIATQLEKILSKS